MIWSFVSLHFSISMSEVFFPRITGRHYRSAVLATFLAFSGVISNGNAIAQTIVIPASYEDMTGVQVNIPFFDYPLSSRYQQLYASSLFEATGITNAVLVSVISFRLHGPASGFSDIYPGVLVELSTTQVNPVSMSISPDDNVGPDPVTVFSGDLVFTAQPCDSDLCPFDLEIPLQNPYLYFPGDGNLLVDIRLPSSIDKNYGYTDIVITDLIRSLLVGEDESTISIGGGMVTQFTIAVPTEFIGLSPASSVNTVLTEHTVTATVIREGLPEDGIQVLFEVVSGPNAGQSSDPGSGECSPDNCVTDQDGRVSWSYTGGIRPGTDSIVASFTGIDGVPVVSEPVEVVWSEPGPKPIPALSEWGMLMAAMGIMLIGTLYTLRKRGSH